MLIINYYNIIPINFATVWRNFIEKKALKHVATHKHGSSISAWSELKSCNGLKAYDVL